MVVLEGAGNMLGSSPNQYLQPDYLSPLSSPLSSKQSPLALLAQTCSAIGADSPTSKSLFESSKRKLSTCSESSVKSESSEVSSKEAVNNNNNKESSPNTSGSSGSNNRPKSGSSSVSPYPSTNSSAKSNGGGKISPLLSPSALSPAFKPYEREPYIPNKRERLSEQSEKSGVKSGNSSTKHSSRSSANVSPKVKSPNPRSSSPQEKEISVVDSKSSKVSSASTLSVETPAKSSSSDQGASPIIRSGLEVLQQGQYGASAAAYNRKLSELSSLSGLGSFPAGFDPMNPAFRPPFTGSPHAHAHALAMAGYPMPSNSPYVSYQRVRSSTGESTIVPLCKDPLCNGCQFGGNGVPHGIPGGGSSSSSAPAMNDLMAAAAAAATAVGFPPSLMGTGSHLFPQSLPSGYPSSLLSQHALASGVSDQTKPYICNWIVGQTYCGRKFVSSEELLQHLRSHTNSNASGSSTSSPSVSEQQSAMLMLQQQQLASLSSPSSLYSAAALLNPSALAAMHRTYPTPPLSPLSAARYHPYAKPMIPPMPPSAAALSNYWAQFYKV